MNISLVKIIGAHSFGQGVTLLATVLTPYFALKIWSLEIFGLFVISGAVSQFFAFVDIGAVQGMSNAIILNKVGNTTAHRRIRSLKLRLEVNTAIFSLLLIVISFYLYVVDININYWGCAILLSISTSFQPLINLLIAKYRIEGQLHKGILFSNAQRAIELSTILISIYFGCNLIVVGLNVLFAKMLYVVYIHRDIKVMRKWKLTFLRKKEIYPSQFFNSIAAQIIIHGFTILSAKISPVVAAEMSIYRTIARLPYQPIAMIITSLSPFLTQEYAKNSNKRMSDKIYILMMVAAVGMLIYGMVSFWLSGYIERYWFSSSVKIDSSILVLYVFATLATIISLIVTSYLSSINKLGTTSFYGLVAYLLIICTALFCISRFEINTYAISVILMLGELCMMCFYFGMYWRTKL